MLYYLLRLIAHACTGSGCDWFIPLSLLLPLLILVMVAVTGWRAFSQASQHRSERRWALALGTLTILSVVGPLISLGLLRDNPDAFIAVATAVSLLLPLTTLVYATISRHA